MLLLRFLPATPNQALQVILNCKENKLISLVNSTSAGQLCYLQASGNDQTSRSASLLKILGCVFRFNFDTTEEDFPS